MNMQNLSFYRDLERSSFHVPPLIIISYLFSLLRTKLNYKSHVPIDSQCIQISKENVAHVTFTIIL